MNQYLAAHYESLKKKYKALTSAEKTNLLESLADMQKVRVCTIRANPKAVQKDVNETFTAMGEEVHELAYTPAPY